MSDHEPQIQARTQLILAQQLGDLVMKLARRQAEAEIAAEAARVERSNGAQGAGVSSTEQHDG